MAFGNGMGSPEELAMKIRELSGQMRPPQQETASMGMNVDNRGGLTMQRPSSVRPGTPGPMYDPDPEKRFGTPASPGMAQSQPPLQPRGGMSPQQGPGGDAMYMVNGTDGPKHIPRSMVEKWINSDAAGRKAIENTNPANR